MKNNPLLMTDGYKTSHHRMYPEGTTEVYSNFTPRSVNYMPKQAKKVVVFGVQYTIQKIEELYNENFFSRPKNEVVGEAKEFLSSYLGSEYDVSHFELLHDLGYLPIQVKSLPEGTIIDEKVPFFTVKNTHKDFFWLPNFLETMISSLLWKPLHSASLAYAYKQILVKHAMKTDADNLGFVDFQGHDFSFRGMQHPESAISSGLGFLTSFCGTDTIPCLQAAEYYYNSKDVGFSVPASEHAVMTAYGQEDEINAFRRLMKQYPAGILSVVSDSFDLWKVCTEFITELKDEILARDGKLVIRPDSGDPVDILCGIDLSDADDTLTSVEEAVSKGVIELLWDVFGGTVNSQGYKVLDSHIGAIYGDSITLERAEDICVRLEAKGFASTNVVLGIGSYSMGYATRDSQGGAVKATHVVVNGESRDIFKDPITDDGVKKSAKGYLRVYQDVEGVIKLKDQCTYEEEGSGLLQSIYADGEFIQKTTIGDIRELINKQNSKKPFVFDISF
jgi:nicotinamide phosphoribosyltransferase